MERLDITKKLKIIQTAVEGLILNASNSGLLNGKMGGVLYFYLLGEKTECMECKELADTILNHVYKDIEAEFMSTDFENGLAGIAWGMEYLKHRGTINSSHQAILDRMDNRIYRHIGYSNEHPAGILNGDLGYICYLLSKIRGREKHRNNQSYALHERLMIEFVNRLSDKIENREMKIEEPPAFHIAWDLPVCLWLLGEVAKTGIYNIKLERIFDQLSPVVLSLFPRLQGNRLNLSLGMLSIFQHCKMEMWQEHASRLIASISWEKMIQQELYKNNLTYFDGIAGISALCRKVADLYPKRLLFPAPKLVEAMISSPFWDDFKADMLKRNNIGLLSGLMGIGLELMYLDEYCRQNVKINDRSEVI